MAKKSKVKKLHKKAWDLIREIILNRAGFRCEICKSKDNLQVDHCFSRTCKLLYYDMANLTCLCKSCHFKKTYRQEVMDLRVYRLVEKREGKEKQWILLIYSFQKASFQQFLYYLEPNLCRGGNTGFPFHLQLNMVQHGYFKCLRNRIRIRFITFETK